MVSRAENYFRFATATTNGMESSATATVGIRRTNTLEGLYNGINMIRSHLY